VWIQSILRHAHDGPLDPQTALHADTFHPTVKAWLFLTMSRPMPARSPMCRARTG